MAQKDSEQVTKTLILSLRVLFIALVFTSVFIGILTYSYFFGVPSVSLDDVAEVENAPIEMPNPDFVNVWIAPQEWRLMRLSPNEKDQVLYGKELIAHTAAYLGPKGTVAPISNGLNCQNCHLKAGTQPWGNNYFAVETTYPKFRARSGGVESKAKRVNDCFERSLNGKALDTTGKEMQAILAYMKWLGSDVSKERKPKGSGIYKLAFMDRAADPAKGKAVYETKCQSCHQANGEGVLAADGKEYTYPPLWGKHSYNDGAGLYRMSNFAGYVKYNMPLGATYENPQLSDEESWDVAAYINSMERPSKDLSKDWPDIAKKPFDHPFGPFIDPFPESQHKYGPFKPIVDWKKKNEKQTTKKSTIAKL